MILSVIGEEQYHLVERLAGLFGYKFVKGDDAVDDVDDSTLGITYLKFNEDSRTVMPSKWYNKVAGKEGNEDLCSIKFSTLVDIVTTLFVKLPTPVTHQVRMQAFVDLAYRLAVFYNVANKGNSKYQPKYYRGDGVDVLALVELGLLAQETDPSTIANKFNIIKYTTRAGHKDDIKRDYGKVIEYAEQDMAHQQRASIKQLPNSGNKDSL